MAELSILRTNRGSGENVVKIEVRDRRRRVVHIEVSLEDFASAITGASEVPCEIKIPARPAPAGAESEEA